VFLEGIQELDPNAAKSVQDLLQQSDVQFADFAPIMQLPVPAKSLVDWYAEDA
jgi:hypothetical protein